MEKTPASGSTLKKSLDVFVVVDFRFRHSLSVGNASASSDRPEEQKKDFFNSHLNLRSLQCLFSFRSEGHLHLMSAIFLLCIPL